MPVSFGEPSFDTSYRFRFWSHRHAFDTTRRIPDDFWIELGKQPPRQRTEAFDKIALKWAAREAGEIERVLKEPNRGRKLTWLECAELAAKENPDLIAAASQERYATLRATVERYLEETRQAAIRPEEVDIAFATAYRNWRRSTPGYRGAIARWRTVKNELQYIRLVCRFALAWNRKTGCRAIALQKLPPTLSDDSQQVALTEPEFGKLIDLADGETERILVIGVTTMLRKANLLGLNAEWFDPEQHWLRIDSELMKGRRGQKRTFSVPVADWTIEMLDEKRRGLLFTSPKTGRPYGWIYDRFRSLADTAGVRQFSLHDLRTTGNSWLARHGVDGPVRKVLLHHSMTQDVTDLYTKVFKDHLREGVSVFDRIRKQNGW